MSLSDIRSSYLQALDLSPINNNLEFIKQLQSKHLEKFSFNNVAVVLSQDISLDSESVYRKIVDQGRGGYCFEHNKLTFDVLSEMGYKVRILLARVVFNNTGQVPRTHRVTLLELNGSQYIVDTGFGHFGARFPISLSIGVDQQQGSSCYRIEQDSDGDYSFQILEKNGFHTLYTFDLARHIESDCLIGHFYSQLHPQATFVNNLIVCKKDAESIRSLRNGEFHQIRDDKTKVTNIDTAAILRSILSQEFGLELSEHDAEFLFSKFSIL